MEKLNYGELAEEIIAKLQQVKNVVLATSADDKVTARMMAPINDGLEIMFSTGANSMKAEQMRKNPNVALAIDNLQIEALAELFGHPSGHTWFVKNYAVKFPEYVALYEYTPEDLLVIAHPKKVTLYKYLGKPCWDVLDVEKEQAYRLS